MGSNAHSPVVSPSTHHSTWQSPVPYLFGGLAVMFGLIAFALLILACSYWKLSGYTDENNNNGENTNSQSVDLELGDTDNSDEKQKKKVTPTYEKNVLVIMAGQTTPTFLANPSSVSNCGSNNGIWDPVKMSTTETCENGTASRDCLNFN